MVLSDTKLYSFMAILDRVTINGDLVYIGFSLMAILNIINLTIYGNLDTMVRSSMKIWPSVDWTINDLKYGI